MPSGSSFMFMRAILPQEQLQVLIDNSVDLIDILDGDVPMQAPIYCRLASQPVTLWAVAGLTFSCG